MVEAADAVVAFAVADAGAELYGERIGQLDRLAGVELNVVPLRSEIIVVGSAEINEPERVTQGETELLGVRACFGEEECGAADSDFEVADASRDEGVEVEFVGGIGTANLSGRVGVTRCRN